MKWQRQTTSSNSIGMNSGQVNEDTKWDWGFEWILGMTEIIWIYLGTSVSLGYYQITVLFIVQKRRWSECSALLLSGFPPQVYPDNRGLIKPTWDGHLLMVPPITYRLWVWSWRSWNGIRRSETLFQRSTLKGLCDQHQKPVISGKHLSGIRNS